jgi:hypothetical protein
MFPRSHKETLYGIGGTSHKTGSTCTPAPQSTESRSLIDGGAARTVAAAG